MKLFTRRHTALFFALFFTLYTTATIPCGLSLRLRGSASSCVGRDTLRLSGASTASQIVWQSGSNSVTVDSAAGSIDTVFIPNAGGSYIAIVTDPGGCLDTSSAVLVRSVVIPSISISINTNDTICRNDQVIFSAVGTNGGNNPDYQWKANGVNVGNSPTYIATNILNGDVYSCVLTSTALCATPVHITSDSITFTVHPFPIVTITNSSPCSVDSITLTASGGQSYHWSDSSSTTSVQALSGSYVVTATGDYGCTASAFYNITPYIPLKDSIVQSNDTLLLVSSGTGEFYQWYLNDSIISNALGTSYVAAQSGSYRISVIDSAGCLTSSGPSVFIETGINTVASVPSLAIYPNPNSGIFTLECSDAGTHTISISDALGRLVLDNIEVQGQYQFDLGSQAEGIYYLHISDGKSIKVLTLIIAK